MTQALAIYAGRKAKAHIERNGLQAKDVRVVAGAAGGPKGLLLLGLDQFIFGQWLKTSNQSVDLLGVSIGAWRMATACMSDCEAGFDRLARDYIAQDYEPTYNQRGKRVLPSSEVVSAEFAKALTSFFAAHLDGVLNHPRYRLHILTSRGRGFLRQTNLSKRLQTRTALGFAGAFFANLIHRPAMSACIERVAFSNRGELPFDRSDYATKQRQLTPTNFADVLQASCSIPFLLNAVNDIQGAAPGSYWDGGLTDYHCHMNYAGQLRDDEIVLVPHFQQQLIAGWLDKSLKWRHKATRFLDNVVVLAPTAQWVRGLPNGKIPDRQDFHTYIDDFAGRVDAWSRAVSQSQQLVQEFKAFISQQDHQRIQLL
ncbi:MAG: hypothetical protein QM533_06135 [Cytophagales bacterium]|nr:hypothetical protein [Cytophagales bacterium]